VCLEVEGKKKCAIHMPTHHLSEQSHEICLGFMQHIYLSYYILVCKTTCPNDYAELGRVAHAWPVQGSAEEPSWALLHSYIFM